jgi:hypothetical protein
VADLCGRSLRSAEAADQGGPAHGTTLPHMTRIAQPNGPYDVIWSEGSAYILGVEPALLDWRAFLRDAGVLVLSDMVWRTDRPGTEAQAGFRVLSHVDLGRDAFEVYDGPLEARIRILEDRLQGSRVRDDLRAALRIYREVFGEFGCEMFVLQRD